MAQPKAKPRAPRPAPKKELKLWQLIAFIAMGLAIAVAFLGVGFAKKTHDEYGQWPWARSAVPPKMFYDHANYKAAGTGATTGLVKVGKTPGGGVIYAASDSKKPAPTSIVVVNPSTNQAHAYTLVPKS